ncbi:hypothetical protein [Endozoicomonas sp. SCSIO W0465]|uniref:hypothetical protein n=1 Tax=Endozoicomonas sp. SCSIO W0465 TaxID=2918516 RepID=UPI002075AE5D|nr:hypothetical protein [Endozoicomonas sp. SCSIO W0465]USE37101.1 hypothetical protein MJO57_02400 [Endozoicomonas sp. SCSIO W0465]
MTAQIAPPAFPAQSFGTGSRPTRFDAPRAFNGHGAKLAPPPQSHFAQPKRTPKPPPSAQPQGLPDNVKSVNPDISVNGSPTVTQPPKTEDPGRMAKALQALDNGELINRGKNQLQEAQKAYTAFGEMNIALKARDTLEIFAACAKGLNGPGSVGWYKNSLEMITALKNIELPPGAPKDLTVTITFPPPDHQAISLIPVGAGLEQKAPIEIYNCYVHALGAMKNQAQELNADQGLAQAEARLNDLLETLKAIQKEINERKQKNKLPVRASEVQFESRYYSHVDKGITISRLANGEEFPFHEATIQSKVPTPAPQPEAAPAPTPTPGED